MRCMPSITRPVRSSVRSEVRAGRLRREDFNDRVGQIVRGSMSDRKDGKGTPWSEAQDRHGRICLHDSILTDAVLTQVLFDGKIDPTAIDASLAEHSLFVEPDEEPSWRKVWNGFLRDAEEFEQAFDALEKEFAARVFENAPLVLRVFGLRLWGAEIRQLAQSEGDVVAVQSLYRRLEAAGQAFEIPIKISHRTFWS